MNSPVILGGEGLSKAEIDGCKVRKATRIVLCDAEGFIAVMYSPKMDIYSLPGGGVDKGEVYVKAAEREALEETGCRIRITEELCMIDEIRRQYSGINRSMGYFAEVEGSKGIPKYSKSEVEQGWQVM